jgi:hypothetical protein
MNRLGPYQKNSAEQTRHGSKITTEGSFLVLRWGIEEVADVMDSAGLTLEDLLVKHLVPCLESMKTLCFKYRGQIVEKCEVPDHDNQLKAAILGLRLFYPER